MRKPDVDKLINEFIKNAEIHGEATYSGKYKVGNKASDRLFKIKKKMSENPSLAEEMLDILLTDSKINVKIWASGIAIDLGYRLDEAVKILEKISTMPDIGILRFDAEMSLKARGLSGGDNSE
ncbi:MAG: hypothetical protein FH749_11195 [Firmicutes bacterium]|nr:hypothetical protein [Bacillota bacterium]